MSSKKTGRGSLPIQTAGASILAEWTEANREKARKASREYAARNREERNKQAVEWQTKNKERHVAKRKEYWASNKAKSAHLTRLRDARKLQATPAWADLSAIERLYEEAQRVSQETGTPHHVDHIVPLAGHEVCGLHVETNLRVIPAVENMRKQNKLLG